MSEKYNLMFNGQILSDNEENAVKEKIVQALKIPEAQKDEFFSGRLIALKKEITLDEALTLKSRLEDLGMLITMMTTSMADMYLSMDENNRKRAQAERLMEAEKEQEKKELRNMEQLAELYSDDDDVKIETAKDAKILGWDLNGRIGRLKYLTGMFAIILVILCLTLIILPANAYKTVLVENLFISIIYTLLMFRLIVLRLHDLNLSAWYYIVLFIPIVRGFMYLYLLLWPGTEDDNEFGHEPEQGSFAGIAIVIVVLFLLAK